MPRGFDDIPGSLPADRIPSDLDLTAIPFSDIVESCLNAFPRYEVDDAALWRDHFSLTGQVRTFFGSSRIRKQWTAYSHERQPRDFKAAGAMISRPTPYSSWVDVPFAFVTSQNENLIGNCSGIISLIPSQAIEGGWKVWMLRTLLENFEGYGHPDDPSPIYTTPASKLPSSHSLQQEVSVVIVGAGQAGLSLAGRLGALSIKYLLLENQNEIGWSWTGKYDGVRQHTIREMNNLPFDRTFKSTDPELLPAKIVAEGFKNYVEKYKINIWLSTEVEKCEGEAGIGWVLDVRKGGERYVVKTRHLVLAMGARLSVPDPPKIPDAASFKGTIFDLGNFKNSSRWKGQKGVVVGSATGAHDVAQDMLDNGLSSITMIQRGKTAIFPIEWIVQSQKGLYNLDIPPQAADRLISTEPLKISREILKTQFIAAASIEKARFDALERVGFRVARDAVLTDWVYLRGGGYYNDVGTSARIVSGEIKVKSGIPIKRFVERGLELQNGEVLDADVVVFATGYQRDPRIQAAGILGREVARSMRISKGLDEDGELEWYMMPAGKALWLLGGAVPQARFNSRFIALQIQAELLGKPFPGSRWEESSAVHSKSMKL